MDHSWRCCRSRPCQCHRCCCCLPRRTPSRPSSAPASCVARKSLRSLVEICKNLSNAVEDARGRLMCNAAQVTRMRSPAPRRLLPANKCSRLGNSYNCHAARIKAPGGCEIRVSSPGGVCVETLRRFRNMSCTRPRPQVSRSGTCCCCPHKKKCVGARFASILNRELARARQCRYCPKTCSYLQDKLPILPPWPRA